MRRNRQPSAGKGSELFRLARAVNDEVRARLHAYLLEMDAFKFEELIKLLLEEMGYDNVATTSPTNDKGVDVVGTIELGISAVREVLQAKRHKGTINQPVLDQLRGSLHRFNAVRGTIITTGRFSKGVEEAAFERGAAPITLIDGEKLVDLLVEHEIGVNRRQVEYLEFAPEKLVQFRGGN
ncbi:MAG: restriction endonuclease [Tetrasphaera sp.]